MSPTFLDRAITNEAAIDSFLLNVATIRESVESMGVRFLHVLQPTPVTKSKLWLCEKYGLETIETLYPGLRKALVESYQKIREKIAQGRGAPDNFLDLSRATDGLDAYLYSDYVHEHRNGHLTRLIGESIARRAAPLMN